MEVRPLLLSLLLITLIGYQLAAFIWRTVAPLQVEQSATTPTSASSPPAADAEGIVARRLFGHSGETPAPTRLDAPDTRLNLTLRGIAAATVPAASRALIAGPDGVEKVYAVGATVPGGATVHEVLADHVLLNRRGTLETLRLPRHGMPAGMATTTVQTTRLLDNFEEQSATAGSDQLAEVVRPQAVLADGQLLGYRIYPGRDRQRFAALGLRAGDLVTAINGVSLTDPGTGMEALQAIAGSDHVTLTVERGGQIENLTLRLEQ